MMVTCFRPMKFVSFAFQDQQINLNQNLVPDSTIYDNIDEIGLIFMRLKTIILFILSLSNTKNVNIASFACSGGTLK